MITFTKYSLDNASLNFGLGDCYSQSAKYLFNGLRDQYDNSTYAPLHDKQNIVNMVIELYGKYIDYVMGCDDLGCQMEDWINSAQKELAPIRLESVGFWIDIDGNMGRMTKDENNAPILHPECLNISHYAIARNSGDMTYVEMMKDMCPADRASVLPIILKKSQFFWDDDFANGSHSEAKLGNCNGDRCTITRLTKLTMEFTHVFDSIFKRNSVVGRDNRMLEKMLFDNFGITPTDEAWVL